MKIVIVEDEQRARRGLKNLITSMGEPYQVVGEAADGRQGCDLIKRLNPDVVFTDIRMPGMDGLDMIQALNEWGVKTCFVILSAYEEFSLARQAISLGVKEYMVKPVTYDEMEELLERLLRQQEGRRKKKREPLSSQYPGAHPLVGKALGIIESSYALRLTQEEIARRLHVTPEYFSSLFHRDVAESFPKFVNKYRIEMAKERLLEGISHREVPYQVGFADSKYFHKVFKDITGESVTEFLRKHSPE